MDSEKKNGPYYKEAFNETGNIVGLVIAGALSAATLNPIPLFIGAGLEALYMLFMPDSKFYKRLVGLRRSIAEKEQAENTEKLSKEMQIANLEKHDSNLFSRYKKLKKIHTEILERINQPSKTTANLMNVELEKINYLLDSYINFLDTYVQYKDYLGQVNAKSIQSDIDRLTKEVFDMTMSKKGNKNEELRKLKQKNIDILTKRKERITQMENTLSTVNAQLEIIEDTLHLINDQMVSLHSTGELGVDLDELVTGVESTERAIFETNRFLSEISRLKA